MILGKTRNVTAGQPRNSQSEEPIEGAEVFVI
jgi:hypothetical protein